MAQLLCLSSLLDQMRTYGASGESGRVWNPLTRQTLGHARVRLWKAWSTLKGVRQIRLGLEAALEVKVGQLQRMVHRACSVMHMDWKGG